LNSDYSELELPLVEVISYRRPADFRTPLETEDRMPALKLYELDNVEGQSTSPFVWRSNSPCSRKRWNALKLPAIGRISA